LCLLPYLTKAFQGIKSIRWIENGFRFTTNS
jgi:hypothetical protein